MDNFSILEKTVPDVSLHGPVNDEMLDSFLHQLRGLQPGGPYVLELSTTGGDADVGRRIATEIAIAKNVHGVDLKFLGKAYVYSAGVSIMSAFPPSDRYLVEGTMLLIHERRIKKELALDGALRGVRPIVEDVRAEIESGQKLEKRGFRQLVDGSKMTMEQLLAKLSLGDWYLEADEAEKLGLVNSELTIRSTKAELTT